jgi:hypothetical protein
MKEHLKALILILACLAVLTPFASNAPDGLERVTETLGMGEHPPMWRGLMPDYSLPTIENPYISTLLAGAFGTLLVLGVAYMVGVAVAKPKKQQ